MRWICHSEQLWTQLASYILWVVTYNTYDSASRRVGSWKLGWYRSSTIYRLVLNIGSFRESKGSLTHTHGDLAVPYQNSGSPITPSLPLIVSVTVSSIADKTVVVLPFVVSVMVAVAVGKT